MSHDVDDDLRRLFAASADDIDALPAGFSADVLGAGSRRRRNRRTTIGAGAAALALVAVAAVWQGPNLVEQSTPPTNHNDTPTQMTTDAWAASLPRGDDVEAAYVDGRTLHVGDRATTIRGHVSRSSSIELLGQTTSGWLARVMELREDAADSSETTGVINSDGVYMAFDDPPRNFLVATVEPAGTMFAAGQLVRSTADGEVLVSLPDGMEALGWVDNGLVLYEPGAPEGTVSNWIWDPGEPGIPPAPIELPDSEPAAGGGAMTPNGLVAINRGDCTELVEYDVAMQPPDVRFCAGQTFALSDSGTVALVRPWTAFDIDSADKTRLPVPELLGEFEDYDAQTQAAYFWEDDNNVVFDLEVGETFATVYIRCVISSQHCERASDKLTDFHQQQLWPID